MVATSGIRNLIREGKSFHIQSSIETGKELGMITMDAALADLVLSGRVTREEAELKCLDKDNFNRLCSGSFGGRH